MVESSAGTGREAAPPQPSVSTPWRPGGNAKNAGLPSGAVLGAAPLTDPTPLAASVQVVGIEMAMRERRMGDEVDPGTASQVAQLALMAMQSRGIPPTPENFSVWYQHQAASNPALQKAIAAIDKAGKGFSPAQSAELYRQHCAGNDHYRQIQLVSERVSGLVEDVTTKLGVATSQTRDYSERLSTLGNGIGSIIDPSELVALVRELEQQTDLMRQRASKLETELERSGREINELKGDLANARRAATTDPLTGLGNRKLFDDVFADEATNARETGEPLSLLVTDIDHFKKFNDTHGHQIGDVVLRLVAERLKSAVKGRDTVARYGGEEFAVILPRTEGEAAARLADQLRAEIAKSRLVVKNRSQDLGRVTLSIGVATLQPGETTDSCFRRADEALYRAKNEGRNRVVTAESKAEAAAAA